MESPLIVLHGKDVDALLTASDSLVLCSSEIAVNANVIRGDGPNGWGPKEQEDVILPRSEWGSGRRVVVDRRYHVATGALLVRVPDPSVSNASSEESSEDILHAGAAHVARCAGVLEVVKEFASAWSVDMRRRIVVLHLACRLPKPYQGALRKIVEEHHGSTLVVLTCTRPFSLDHGIHSRGVYVPIPSPVGPVVSSGFDPMGIVNKMATATATAKNGQSQSQSQLHEVLDACAKIDSVVARIRALGGDIVAARNAGIKALNEVVKNSKKKKIKSANSIPTNSMPETP